MAINKQPESDAVAGKQQPEAVAPSDKTGGICILKPRLGRPIRYGEQWREYDPNEKEFVRKTEFFETELGRNKRAVELAKMKREGCMSTATRAQIEDIIVYPFFDYVTKLRQLLLLRLAVSETMASLKWSEETG